MSSRAFEPSSYQTGVTSSGPVCIDLFCGAGGLTLGFCQAGGLPVAAVDNDLASTNTHKRMFPMCKEVFCGDIESWHPRADLASVDVMIGGPPCGGFSLARGFRFLDDPRNHLYKHFVRLVDVFRPLWIVLENVPGITNIGNGAILKQIYEDFARIGYWIDCRVINMAQYGVPQIRTRAIFVGSRVASSFEWPEETHCARGARTMWLFGDRTQYTTVKEALGDLPWPLGKYFAHRANSQMRGPRNRRVDKDPAFTLRVRGDEFALCSRPAKGAFVPGPVPDRPLVYCPVMNAFQWLMREDPPVWRTDFLKPRVVESPAGQLRGTRRLSIREQARLQTFPDWFEFSGSQYAQSRQIGNAVPPLFARQLFAAIFRKLGYPERGEYQFGSREQVGLKGS